MVQVAARWRVHLALIMSDQATARTVVEWVRQGNGEANMKAEFLQDHAWVAAWVGTK